MSEDLSPDAYDNGVPYSAGAAIRARRKELGLTLEQLAERLDTTAQAIQRYETSLRKMSIAKFLQIADALDNTPPAVLLPGGDGLSDAERALVKRLREHPEERVVMDSTLEGLLNARKSATTP